MLSKFFQEVVKREAERKKMWGNGTVITPEQCLSQASTSVEKPPASLTEKAEIDHPPWEKEKKGLYPVLTGTFEVDIDDTIGEERGEGSLEMKLVKKWEARTRLNEHQDSDENRENEGVPDNLWEGPSGRISAYDTYEDYNEGMLDREE